MELTIDRIIKGQIMSFLDTTELGEESTDFWAIKDMVELHLFDNDDVNTHGYFTEDGKWHCAMSTVSIPLNQLIKAGIVGAARERGSTINIYYLVSHRHDPDIDFKYTFIQEEYVPN